MKKKNITNILLRNCFPEGMQTLFSDDGELSKPNAMHTCKLTYAIT